MTEETLERYAASRRIAVYRLPLRECGSLAIDCGHERSAVGLDDSRRVAPEVAATRLAHELGHCCTGSFYTRCSAVDSVERNEARAWAWAYEHVLSPARLRAAAQRGIVEPWELAERFGVTEDMVRSALEYYDAKGTAIAERAPSDPSAAEST